MTVSADETKANTKVVNPSSPSVQYIAPRHMKINAPMLPPRLHGGTIGAAGQERPYGNSFNAVRFLSGGDRPNINTYGAAINQKIRQSWSPPKGNVSKHVVVVFKVHHDGALSNLRLEKSSGLAIADQAALKAVEAAAPFPSPPAGATDDVDIECSFDYDVGTGTGRGVFKQR